MCVLQGRLGTDGKALGGYIAASLALMGVHTALRGALEGLFGSTKSTHQLEKQFKPYQHQSIIKSSLHTATHRPVGIW